MRASSDFTVRCSEVQRYLDFVRDLEAGNSKLDPTPPDLVELLKTLKAASYLLMYNLVESTARNAFDDLFDTLKQDGIKFDECREELQMEILKRWQKLNPEKLGPLTELASDIVVHAFRDAKLFEGNVDTRRLRHASKCFGVELHFKVQPDLVLAVKDKRNNLAHGVMSFSEIGRDATYKDLEDTFADVKAMLTETLDRFEEHITNQRYLKSAP